MNSEFDLQGYDLNAWLTKTWVKIDPEKNMRRFYRAEVCQDIFGTWLVILSWGRLENKKPSRVVIKEVDSVASALTIIDQVARTRASHHYTLQDSG